MRYKPHGGSIYIYDPFYDKHCPYHELAIYDASRDLVLLPRKRRARFLEVPAVDFYGKYKGDFWATRGRWLVDIDGRRERAEGG